MFSFQTFLDFLDDLNYVFVTKRVFLAASLGLVFGGFSPDPGKIEFGHDTLVESVAEFFDSGVGRVQYDGFFVIGHLSLWFGIDTKHVTPIPNLFHQFFKIPLVLGGYRNVVLFHRQVATKNS